MLNGTDQTAKPYDIYAWVSRIKSKDIKKSEPSTGGQVAICRLRLAELDLPEGKVLVDPGRSAWDPAVRRPAWDELMDRLERGVSGGFIVFDLERFTRQPKDGERMIELAPQPARIPARKGRRSGMQSPRHLGRALQKPAPPRVQSGFPGALAVRQLT
jgi:hypothetical protein